MKKYIISLTLMWLLLQTIVPASRSAVTNEDDLLSGKEFNRVIKELKDELSEIKKEIKGLKNFINLRLKQKPSPRSKPLTGKTAIKGDPFLGSMEAPLILVEFSDYQCPFCGKYFRDTLPKIMENYINNGKVRYVFKDFPLASHKNAQKAAEAAHCAGEEEKFWEMHNLLYENQRKMALKDLIEYAADLKLEANSFNNCINSGRFAEGIKKDIKDGKSSGVTGTPSFLLGKLNNKGEVAGSIIRGAKSFATFERAIEAKLK